MNEMVYVRKSKREKHYDVEQELKLVKIQAMIGTLKKDIIEERESTRTYSLKAEALERWGFHDEAKALKKMAKDEHGHSVTLQSIIGTITAQITEKGNPCGRGRRKR